MTETETETEKSEKTQKAEHALYIENLLREYDGALSILDEEHHRIVGREKEIQTMREYCERPNTPYIILLGGAGTGKTASVKEMKRQIREEQKNVEFYKLSIGKMAAEGEGVLKTRIASIFGKLQHYEELRSKVDPGFKVYLFIDEFHMIQNIFSGVTKIGGELVKEPLSGNSIRLIAATTEEEYQDYIAVDDALSRRLKPIRLQEVGSAELMVILRSWLETSSSRSSEEEARKISSSITDHMLKKIIASNAKFRKDEVCEPSKSLDVLESLVGIMKVRKVPASDELINEIFLNSYNIELERKIDFDKAVATIRDQVKGQSLATYIMEDVLLERFYRYETEGKPVTALLIGPTGVGKTQIVRAFVEGVYGKESNALYKFDMQDYKTKESGADFRADIGKVLKKNPSATLLIDEIEKAHIEVLDVFLGMLDDGIVSYSIKDTAGTRHVKKASLQNANIFATGNAGAEIFDDLNRYTFRSVELTDENYNVLTQEMDQYWVKQKVAVLNALKSRKLKPEFLGRWQHIIPLFALEKATMVEIVAKCILEHRINLKKRYDIDLRLKNPINWEEQLGQPYLATDVTMFIVEERGSQLDTTAGGARNLQKLVKDSIIRPTLRAMRSHPKNKIFYAVASQDSRIVNKSKSRGSGRIEVLTPLEYEEQKKNIDAEKQNSLYFNTGVGS